MNIKEAYKYLRNTFKMNTVYVKKFNTFIVDERVNV